MRSVLQLYIGLVTTPATYIRFLSFSKKKLIAFVLFSSVLLSILWSATTIAHQLPRVQTQLQQVATEFINHYPADLIISWDGKKLALAPEKQYSIYYPSIINSVVLQNSTELPDRIADFVPNQIDVVALNKHHQDALFVVSPTECAVQRADNEWQKLPLTDLLSPESFTLTKTTLRNRIEQSYVLSPQLWRQVGVYISVVAPFLVLLGFIWNGSVLVVLAYIIAVKLYRAPLTGKQLVRVSIPILVTATLIQLLAELIYKDLPFSLLSIGYWLLLVLVIRHYTQNKKQ
jgi:hypothetical protein